MAKKEGKLIANNKKAYHDYFILEKYEAGIVLHGTEVKSLRMGQCSIKEAFIRIENGEMFIYGMHVSPYEKGNIFNKDPLRPRKLLLHKKEIELNDIKFKLANQQNAMDKLDFYYSQFRTWADEFDNSTMEQKKMIACQLIREVKVSRGYELEIVFDLNYEQFLSL